MFFLASNIVLMSDKAVLVDFGLTVQMTEDVYTPRDLRGTEVRKQSKDLTQTVCTECINPTVFSQILVYSL